MQARVHSNNEVSFINDVDTLSYINIDAQAALDWFALLADDDADMEVFIYTKLAHKKCTKLALKVNYISWQKSKLN